MLSAGRRRLARLRGAVLLAVVAAIGAVVASIPRAPHVEVTGRARLITSGPDAPLSLVAAAPSGHRLVAASRGALEWVDEDGRRMRTPWLQGSLQSIAWAGSNDSILVVSSSASGDATLYRVPFASRAAVRIAEGPFVQVESSHDGRRVAVATDTDLAVSDDGSPFGVVLRCSAREMIGDFDFAPSGDRIGVVVIVPNELPAAEVRVVNLKTKQVERAGSDWLGLEGGRTAFSWPQPDLWVFARISDESPGAAIVASKAGRLAPRTELGRFPLATLWKLRARGERLFLVTGDLQSDVLAGDWSGRALENVRRLTSTPANERTTGFVDDEVLAMSDAFQVWSPVMITLDGSMRRIGPHDRSFTWPEAAPDGLLYGFSLEPVGRDQVRPVLMRWPGGERVSTLGSMPAAVVPPSPRGVRLRCSAAGACWLFQREDSVLHLSRLGGPEAFTIASAADSTLGVGLSSSGRHAAIPERGEVSVVDLEQRTVQRVATASGCVVHGAAFLSETELLTAEECAGETAVARLGLDGTRAVLYASDRERTLAGPEVSADGRHVAFIAKEAVIEGWLWTLE